MIKNSTVPCAEKCKRIYLLVGMVAVIMSGSVVWSVADLVRQEKWGQVQEMPEIYSEMSPEDTEVILRSFTAQRKFNRNQVASISKMSDTIVSIGLHSSGTAGFGFFARKINGVWVVDAKQHLEWIQ